MYCKSLYLVIIVKSIDFLECSQYYYDIICFNVFWKNESISKNYFLKNYLIFLCLIAILKWIGKLVLDFLYLV